MEYNQNATVISPVSDIWIDAYVFDLFSDSYRSGAVPMKNSDRKPVTSKDEIDAAAQVIVNRLLETLKSTRFFDRHEKHFKSHLASSATASISTGIEGQHKTKYSPVT